MSGRGCGPMLCSKDGVSLNMKERVPTFLHNIVLIMTLKLEQYISQPFTIWVVNEFFFSIKYKKYNTYINTVSYF